ncbi:MAG: gluconate 2-dehydrogenase subunit 3 family protein [Alphaproteobacteria bacterium]
MSIAKLSRRLFLKSTGAAVGIVTVGSSVLMASDGAWAMSMMKIDAGAAKTLIRMARDLYPHDTIDDAVYAKVIEKLDQDAAKDAKLAQMLSDGAKALDTAAGGNYTQASAAKRLKILAAMESDAFFQKVRGAMVNNFYNDPAVWKKLGYQGSSAEFGGYLHRGFDDVSWLPKA